MNVIDTDIFSDIMKDVPAALARLATIPVDQQAIAVVTAEEVVRGQLASIRAAEAGKGGTQLPVAYGFFLDHLKDLAT